MIVVWVIGMIGSATFFLLLIDWIVDRRERNLQRAQSTETGRVLVRANEIMDRVDDFLEEIGRPI